MNEKKDKSFKSCSKKRVQLNQKRPVQKSEESSESRNLVGDLFAGKDMDFKKSDDLSEMDKKYKGISSKFDRVNLHAKYSDSDENERDEDDWEGFWYDSKASVQKQPMEDVSVMSQNPMYLLKNERAEQRINALFTDDNEPGEVPVNWKQAPSSYLQEGARAAPIKNDVQDEENKNLVAIIAEDLVKREKFIIVGKIIYYYNGKFYFPISERKLNRMIYQVYGKEIGHASPIPIIQNVVKMLEICIQQDIEEFPVNSDIIIFENGTLEIKTGRLRSNSPKDLANSALGINYNPGRWGMPNTQYFLETIADGDSDLYELMLQVIGYILSNDIRAKSFFYLEGVGDAGKSRFCDLIASFFPTTGANKVARIALQDLGAKFAMGNLVNAKLNISEDLPDIPLSSTTVSRIKMLSDSNRLEAEAKYVQAFSFKPTCKLLFASNHPLRIKDYDAAFINRVVYIPFLKPIPKHKQDKDILIKMQGELSALFNHAFAAYKRLVASGYAWAGAERYKPEICVVNSGIPIEKELTLRRFVETCCICGEGYTTSVSEMQERYQDFCRKQGRVPIAGDRFSRELFSVLPDTVVRIKIGNQRRGFKGIRLKEF